MIFTDLFENTDQPSRVKFRGTDHDIGEERYRFVINGDVIFFNFPSDEDNPDPDSPSFEEILARVQSSGEARHYRITPAEQRAIAKKIAAERRRYLDQRRQDMAENTVKGKSFQKTMVRPEEAYKLLTGQEPKAFAIDVLMPDQSAVKRLQAAIGNQAKIRGDDSIAGDGMGIQIVTPVFPDGRTAQQAFEMMMDLIRTHGGEFNRSTGAIIATPASQDMAEAMKPSDIPPGMRDRLTMRDIEAERPQGAFRFRVVTPQGDQIDFMDQAAAEQRARAIGGRVEPIDPQPQGIPDRQRYRVQDPQGSRPAATFTDRKQAERYAAAKKLPIEFIPESEKKNARIERILKMLRARHPQAENDLEALIFDFRSQQSQDRSDISRLDAENDAEEADIQRLERMLDLIRRRRGAAAEPAVTTESLRDGEYHVATVTLDDGTKKKVRITSDEGFRDRIEKHFERQGRQVTDIDVDYSVRSDLDESKKKPQPTKPELWGRAKSAARSKFDVYPSAYANAWAAKWYKARGGGWRMGKPKKD
jgi:hypothetical protein